MIGNHADELTPWVSVMARKCNARGFIVIPCCLFDFHGKFQRRAKDGTSDAESLYQNYIHYIASVGSKCGYEIRIDKLRIPSTKRICIIGTSTSLVPGDQALAYAQAKVSQFPSTDSDIQDLRLFKPRSPIEKVNNLTQIDRQVASGIVGRIFNALLEGEENLEIHPDYVKPWNVGRRDLTLPLAASLLTQEEREVIGKQGKGLQTLLKNHHQVFRISSGHVLLRRPLLDQEEEGRRRTQRVKKVKCVPCYFYLHHPNSCPLQEPHCTYLHSSQ